MEQLSRDFIKQENVLVSSMEISFHSQNKPEKILQFGEGNFLRAFFDFFIDELNAKGLFNGSIIVVPPIEQTASSVDIINNQNGLYTVILRGLENNSLTTRQRVVSSISRAINPFRDYDLYLESIKNPDLRFIVSNTTEAGIVYLETNKPDESLKKPPASFPAKITSLLYERYRHFDGSPKKGFIFIPCELIDNNGSTLKEIVLRHTNDWELPIDFVDWVKSSNHFTNTLVDRIVTGYPKDEAKTHTKNLGYRDELLVTGEIFHFFAIEAGEAALKEINDDLPFSKAGFNVVLTSDVTPYKVRKVRILNGAHTMSIPAAILSGKSTVGEMMNDSLFVDFLRKGIYQEIIPSIDIGSKTDSGIDKSDLTSFADSVFDRFSNPYIKHSLFDIALNSISKFKARVLPSILDYYYKTGSYPQMLTFSFAALLTLYVKNDYKITDSADVVEFFSNTRSCDLYVQEILSNQGFWDMDLTGLPGFAHEVNKNMHGILTHGVESWIKQIMQ